MTSPLSRLSVCALALGLLAPLGCLSYPPKRDGRPTIRIQQMQLPARRRGEIVASDVYASAAPLLYDDGQLRGETFDQCQGMIAVKAVPQDDGRVRLEFVPELHHGEAQRRF